MSLNDNYADQGHIRVLNLSARIWANAQRDGRPTEYRWRPLLKMTNSKSSVIPFLVPRRKVWLTLTARMLCSNAANIGERTTWTQSEFCTWQNSVRGRKPSIVCIQCTSAGDGQTSCKVWLTSVERRRCSNEAKTRNPLKFVGVPQTPDSISAVSGPKFTITVRTCGGHNAV